MDLTDLKTLLLRGDPAFWSELSSRTLKAKAFDELIFLSTLRKKALSKGLLRPSKRDVLRLALVGGYSLYPLHELLTQLLDAAGVECELFLGEYDNYVFETTDESSPLLAFRPDVVVLLPSARRCTYRGGLADERGAVEAAATEVVEHLLGLCTTVHDRCAAELVLCNFMLPARRDLGSLGSRLLASNWSFKRWVNLELGLRAPRFVSVCDLEFLGNRHGALDADDPRGWFESKQLCSAAMLVEVCSELCHLALSRRCAPKKVLALDLDNTLWGGVVADDGVEGIEIGDTSARGEAFKEFQRYVATLKQRGILLAVCSKNDHAKAAEAFERHPEMVLRMDDFVAFKASWEPKADSLLQMASELNLGIDSFVFVDDNPAEIEMVRQFAPDVSTILLDGDPADFVGRLQDSRLFEPRSITAEDALRSGQYQAERARQSLLGSVVDMDAYLASLEMVATISAFTPLDVPRLAQLINKSNQFNLTTRRRAEAEVEALIERSDYVCFAVRLQDRFGDHGLISIAIGQVIGSLLEIDTWLMSCRVLKRQVEEIVLNELCSAARLQDCSRIEGIYLATPKNEMVRDLYPRLGFQTKTTTSERGLFELDLASFTPRATHISVRRTA